MFKGRLYCKKCFMSAWNDSDEDEKNDVLDISVRKFKKMGYKLREDQDKGYEEYGEINDFFQQIEANEL